jgi:hypothetical protein
MMESSLERAVKHQLLMLYNGDPSGHDIKAVTTNYPGDLARLLVQTLLKKYEPDD